MAKQRDDEIDPDISIEQYLEGLGEPGAIRRQPSQRLGKQVLALQRRSRAVRMSAAGYSRAQIQIALGYKTAQALNIDLYNVRKYWRERLNESANEHVARELARLEDALQVVSRILHSKHLAHSGGKIIHHVVEWSRHPDGTIKIDEEGNPIAAVVEVMEDVAPLLAAATQITRISESIRKLLGLDRPTKVEVTGAVQHIYGTDIDDI